MDLIFSSLSFIKGSTGISNIPVKIPSLVNFLIASNLLEEGTTLGSIFLHKLSWKVVIVIFIKTGEWLLIFLSISISLRIKSLLVAILIPNPYLLISSKAPLVKLSFLSKGLYVSLIAPIPITPFFLLLFNSLFKISNAFLLALTESKFLTP